MKVVGISDWLSKQASKSLLLKDHDIRTISNNIDTDSFFPIEKSMARKVLGMDTAKKVVLAGSTNARDPYKGFGHYLEALHYLDPEYYYLCFFGKVDQGILRNSGFE